MIDGDMDAGAWSCGMVAGLIHDIPTVQGTDRPHHGGSRAIIRGRLVGFLDGVDVKGPSRAVA